jgi:thioredoxin
MLEVKRFSAVWCGPCRALAPVMEGIKGEYTDVVFETIDVDVDHEQASKFAIRSVPTVVFVKDGVEVDRLIGVNSKMAYENKINEHKV